MDNYFHECPPMMNDGRLFTDYRSSQVREELFRYKNCISSENEGRILRMENADDMMDHDWNYIRATKSCFPKKHCYHKHPTTRVTTAYNNAELLAYNGDIEAPKCDPGCFDYRMTVTKGSLEGRQGCVRNHDPYAGYPPDRCPVKCSKTNRLKQEKLYHDEFD